MEPAQYCRRFVRWIRHEVIDGDDFARFGGDYADKDSGSEGRYSPATGSPARDSGRYAAGSRSSLQRTHVDMEVMHEEADADLDSSSSDDGSPA